MRLKSLYVQLQFKPQAGNREIDDAEEGAACCPLSCTAHNIESDALLMLTATAQHRWSSLTVLSREHERRAITDRKLTERKNLLLIFRIICQGEKEKCCLLLCRLCLTRRARWPNSETSSAAVAVVFKRWSQ